MPKRYAYDLSHASFMDGRIGRLQTLSVIPVLPGDSMKIDVAGLVRLSQMRRQVVLDSRFDIFAFFVKNRHLYDDSPAETAYGNMNNRWVRFIKEGVDGVQGNLPTYVAPTDEYFNCLGHPNMNGNFPLYWSPAAYNYIWNRYFRVPTDDSHIQPKTHTGSLFSGKTQTAVSYRTYGLPVTFMKRGWTTGIERETDLNDRKLSVSGSGNDTYIDLLDLSRIKARFKTELEREWFAQRYSDVLKMTYGTGASVDQEERPDLLMVSRNWLSGHDVDGTADQNLGAWTGKAVDNVGGRMPWRHFNEHGCIWIMACLRFPPIHHYERHYLLSSNVLSYKALAGDPTLIMNEPPIELDNGAFFDTSRTDDLGYFPYAQWFRFQPNFIHSDFRALEGFPFLNKIPRNKTSARYFTEATFDYDEMFKNTQLEHWHSQIGIHVSSRRVVPPGIASIMAGTK